MAPLGMALWRASEGGRCVEGKSRCVETDEGEGGHVRGLVG